MWTFWVYTLQNCAHLENCTPCLPALINQKKLQTDQQYEQARSMNRPTEKKKSPLHVQVVLLPLMQIDILEDRDIPDTRHIEGETIHRTKCIRNRHHVVHNVIIGLCLGK